MVFGYVYPAYECYKTVEVNATEIEHLRFWCQYWILVALLTAFERIADAFVFWLPMYSEAKLAFYVYLWYPKTQGATYIYDNFLRPFIAKHETEIDRYLLEFKTRVGSVMVKFWQKAASYAQKSFFEVLQYVASQSQEPRKQYVQQLQQQPEAHRTRSASPTPPRHVCAAIPASSSETAATDQSSATEEPTLAVTINGEESKSPSQGMAVDDAMSMKTHGWFRRRPPAVDPSSLGGRIGALTNKSVSLD